MKQTLLALVEKKDLGSLQSAQNMEKQYESQIPSEFYKEFKAAESEIELETYKTVNNIIEIHVKRMFELLLKDDKIPPKVAREIVVWRFLKYRSMGHLRRFIPAVAKDQEKVKLAIKSNEAQKAHKVELFRAALAKRGLTPADLGRIGGQKNFENNGILNMKHIGSKGGIESQSKQADKAVELTAVQMGVELHKDIVVELVAGSKEADKILELLGAPFYKAYIEIDVNGKKILDVFNNDNPKKQERRLEKPLATT